MAKSRWPKRKRETDFWFGPLDVVGVALCILFWEQALLPPTSFLGASICLFLAMVFAYVA